MSEGPDEAQQLASHLVGCAVDGVRGIWKMHDGQVPVIKSVVLVVQTEDGTFAHWAGCFCPTCAADMRSTFQQSLVQAVAPVGRAH